MSTTVNSIKNNIRDICDSLKSQRAAYDTELNVDKFRTSADRLASTALDQNKSVLTKDEIAEVEAFIKSEVERTAAEYREGLAERLRNGTGNRRFEYSNSSEQYGYDYDPYTEDGISVYPVNRIEYVRDENGKMVKSVTKEMKRPLMSIYHATNNSYSGSDIIASVTITPNGDIANSVTAVIGELSTISYSIYQDKKPVRVLGNMGAKDYVFSGRTIAGSLVFMVFNKHWLIDIYNELKEKMGMANWHFLADELPPMSITLTAASEYGFNSKMVLHGVRLMSEGQVISTNNILLENTYQFVATDIEYLDTLYSYQHNGYSRHSAATISRQIVDRNTVSVTPEPTEYRMTSDSTTSVNSGTLSGSTATQITEAKKLLYVTVDDWNRCFVDNGYNVEKTRNTMYQTYTEIYNDLKKNKNFISTSDQICIGVFYDNAIDIINSIYNEEKEYLHVKP